MIDSIRGNERVERMIRISQGWYTISKQDGKLYFNDLRFGLISLEPQSQDFVFKYEIGEDERGNITFTEVPKDQQDAKAIASALWTRIKGN